MLQDRKGVNSTVVNLMRKKHRILKGRCQSIVQSLQSEGVLHRKRASYLGESLTSCQAEAGEKVTSSDVPATSIARWGQGAQGNKTQNNLSPLSCVLVTGPDQS